MPPPTIGEGASEKYARMGQILGAHFSSHPDAVQAYALHLMHIQTYMLFDAFETLDAQIQAELAKIKTAIDGYLTPKPQSQLIHPG